MKLTSVKKFIQESQPELKFFVEWLQQLVRILREQPPGCLIKADGLLVTPAGKLKLSEPQELQPGDVRHQVWSLGRLFLQWLAWSGPAVRQEFAHHLGLRRLLDRMTSSDPGQRPSNLEILRVQLEQARPGRPPGSHTPTWLARRNFYGRKLAVLLVALVSVCCLLNWLLPATS